MCLWEVSLKTTFQKWFQRRQNVLVDIALLMGNQCGNKGITSLRDGFHWAANRPEQITYVCMPEKKRRKKDRHGSSLNVSEHFMTKYEQLFCRAALKIALCFGIHPLSLPIFSFSLTLILSACFWQRMVMTEWDESLIDLSWAAQWEEGSLLTL